MSTTGDVAPGAWPEDMGEVGLYADTSMTLPGKSEPGAGCGEYYPREFCDECAALQWGAKQCGGRGCPNCWETWRRKRAYKITRRLAAARYAAESGLQKRAIHAVVSAPEGRVTTLQDVQDGFKRSYELAREKGVRGGVAIFHGFRVRSEVKEEWGRETNGGSDGPKLWAWVREDPRDWRGLTYWSPHWHIIGLSADFEADDPDDQDGWVARRIRSLKSFRLTEAEGYGDMARTAMYLLSHAAFETDASTDSVRWFAGLHPCNFNPDPTHPERKLDSPLSEGSWSTVDRYAAEACSVLQDESGSGGPEPDECDECGSTALSPIWDAGMALQNPGWCNQIGRDKQRRLTAAWEWMIGDRIPPPGLQRPRTEEEAKEALAHLV